MFIHYVIHVPVELDMRGCIGRNPRSILDGGSTKIQYIIEGVGTTGSKREGLNEA